MPAGKKIIYKIFIFSLLLPSVLFFTNCRSRSYYSKKLKENNSSALYYERGDIIITGERKNYGRHGSDVSLNKRFLKTIPASFKSELEAIVIKSIQNSLPDAAVKTLEEIPSKEIRTINGKILLPDYSKINENILITWRFDIYYRCRQAYYMDRCQGEITASMQLRDSEKKGFRRKILIHRKTLNYINPSKETIEETEKITEELKEKLPGSISVFFNDLLQQNKSLQDNSLQ